MSDVSLVNNSAYDMYQRQTQNETKSNEMGRDQFLELMIAQLNNQNPLEPKENGDFIAQLAQFSTVEGIESMGSSLDGMAMGFKSNQAIQASNLVGKQVTLEGNTEAELQNGQVTYGQVEIPPGMDALKLEIYDDENTMVEQIELGYQPNGTANFKWNGVEFEINGDSKSTNITKLYDEARDKGEEFNPNNLHPEQNYRFQVVGNFNGQQEILPVSMSARVESVSIKSNNDLQLNLAGNETTTLDQVKQIN